MNNNIFSSRNDSTCGRGVEDVNSFNTNDNLNKSNGDDFMNSFKENYNKCLTNKYMEKGMKKGFQVWFYAGDFLGREDIGQLYIREDCIEIKKGVIFKNQVFAVIPFDEIKSINVGEEGGLINKHVQVSINANGNYYNIKFGNGGMNEVMPVIDLLNEKVNASQVNDDVKFCSQCGSPVQAGSKFCSQCGSKL